MTCSTDFFEDKILNNHVLNDPFDEFLSIFLEEVKKPESSDIKSIKIIARSTSVPMVHSIISKAKEINSLGISVKAIFTQLAPFQTLDRWLEEICEYDSKVINDTIRWAKNNALHDAHEQLILGNDMCWCGDSMKRPADSRMINSHFEKNSPEEYKTSFAGISSNVELFHTNFQEKYQKTIA